MGFFSLTRCHLWSRCSWFSRVHRSRLKRLRNLWFALVDLGHR
jgi:hypothetical protein